MQVVLSSYDGFYRKKHQGRKLEWDHALGTMTLRAQFDAGSKELSVSLYQGIILLLFNDAIELSFWDILEQTRISESYFSSSCLSNDYLMCDRRTRIAANPAKLGMWQEASLEEISGWQGCL
jgi:cullin-4